MSSVQGKLNRAVRLGKVRLELDYRFIHIMFFNDKVNSI